MDRSAAHDSRALANRILDIRQEAGESLTIMQLIKLAYIADGWTLALLNRPLVDEAPEAWQYGPVYRSIYNAFSGVGARPVTARAHIRGTNVPISENFSDEEEAIIRMVVNSYGKLSAYALSNLTHQTGTPWSDAFDDGQYTEISIEKMCSHFTSLKEKRLAKKQPA